MGFDVTAAHIVIFVALLSGGSAALGGYWTAADNVAAARSVETDRMAERVHTNLTIDSVAYNSGPDRATITITNTGSTVLDFDEFVYIVDGTYIESVTIEKETILGVTTATSLILPGETLVVDLRPIYTSPTNVKVVTSNGAAAYWSA